MRVLIEKISRKIFSAYLFPGSVVSYSQNGEDLIIKHLFEQIGILSPVYLDIGANDPVFISNTYLFYTKSCSGVCVEPNPYLYKKIKKVRKKDICINAGVAYGEMKEADFYVFHEKASGLGTFSKKDAEFWEKTGTQKLGKHQIKEVLKIRLININEIIQNHFDSKPNFISIDVEGLDLEILQTLDFDRYKPEVFCIETLKYVHNDREIKDNRIASFLETKGYFIYADTYINTIFCLKSAYKYLE